MELDVAELEELTENEALLMLGVGIVLYYVAYLFSTSF